MNILSIYYFDLVIILLGTLVPSTLVLLMRLLELSFYQYLPTNGLSISILKTILETICQQLPVQNKNHI